MRFKTRLLAILLTVLAMSSAVAFAELIDAWKARNLVKVNHPSLKLTLPDGSPYDSYDWGVFSYEGQERVLELNLTVAGSQTVKIWWNATNLPPCFILEVYKNGTPWLPGETVTKQPGESFKVTIRLKLATYIEGEYEFTITFYAEPRQ